MVILVRFGTVLFGYDVCCFHDLHDPVAKSIVLDRRHCILGPDVGFHYLCSFKKRYSESLSAEAFFEEIYHYFFVGVDELNVFRDNYKAVGLSQGRYGT